MNHSTAPQQQQIFVDLKNATKKVCERVIVGDIINKIPEHICGCELFIPCVSVFTVSALLSPTGQELMMQQPVLVCMDCRKVLK